MYVVNMVEGRPMAQEPVFEAIVMNDEVATAVEEVAQGYGADQQQGI